MNSEVTELLLRWSEGDDSALDALMPLVYEDLRRLASYYLSQEARAQTLQSTALVHEVYLRLCCQQNPDWQGRAHFFAVGSRKSQVVEMRFFRWPFSERYRYPPGYVRSHCPPRLEDIARPWLYRRMQGETIP